MKALALLFHEQFHNSRSSVEKLLPRMSQGGTAEVPPAPEPGARRATQAFGPPSRQITWHFDGNDSGGPRSMQRQGKPGTVAPPPAASGRSGWPANCFAAAKTFLELCATRHAPETGRRDAGIQDAPCQSG